MPIENRKRCGKTIRPASAAATVTALNSTLLPAVCRVRASASRPGPRGGHLLPVAGDDQEAVVDREAEAQADGEVERVDREGHRLVEEPDGRGSPRRSPRAPISGGSRAATTPRKTHSDSRKMIGKAIISARARSSPMIVPTCSPTTAAPPRRTSGSSPGSRSMRAAASSTASSPIGLEEGREVGGATVLRDQGVAAAVEGGDDLRPRRGPWRPSRRSARPRPGPRRCARRRRAPRARSGPAAGWPRWRPPGSRGPCTNSAPGSSNPPEVRLAVSDPPTTTETRGTRSRSER